MSPAGRAGSAATARFAIRVAMFVAGAGILFSTERLGAQAPMSAGLARVLAETADGLRDGQPHWIVANPRYPYKVSGVFPTEAAARASLVPGQGDVVTGPWITPPGFDPPGYDLGPLPPGPIVIIGCKHMLMPIPSIMGPYCPNRILRLPDIEELVLVIRTGRETIRVNLMEEGTADAVFLTPSSLDKFVLPYYSRVYGPAFAKEMGDSIRARAARLRP
jgi:hypothetical protein